MPDAPSKKPSNHCENPQAVKNEEEHKCTIFYAQLIGVLCAVLSPDDQAYALRRLGFNIRGPVFGFVPRKPQEAMPCEYPHF
jgi:hypothetical protein